MVSVDLTIMFTVKAPFTGDDVGFIADIIAKGFTVRRDPMQESNNKLVRYQSDISEFVLNVLIEEHKMADHITHILYIEPMIDI